VCARDGGGAGEGEEAGQEGGSAAALGADVVGGGGGQQRAVHAHACERRGGGEWRGFESVGYSRCGCFVSELRLHCSSHDLRGAASWTGGGAGGMMEGPHTHPSPGLKPGPGEL
jgi:hypothetical protein